MGRRIAYGNAFSENDWPIVDTASCNWVRIPLTNNVTLQIQIGYPTAILRAFAADFSEHVEPLRDRDSACWTRENKVGTSNHLGGTGMDLNWDGPDERTFRYGIPGEVAYPNGKLARVKELLEFYEGTVYCGGFWSIRDWMHFQLGYGTYDRQLDRPTQKTIDFVARKIRADGLSTFKRGNEPMPNDPAQTLVDAVPNLDLQRATRLLPAIRDGLTYSGCNSAPRIAMWLAQIGHESGSFVYTEEIQKNGRYAPYIGRTWIQITWDYNYRACGNWCVKQGLIEDSLQFLNDPESLADIRWAGLGVAWYWTDARPMINSMCDSRDIEGVTRAINGGLNGFSDRQQRHQRAKAIGDRLLVLLGEGDDMASVPQEQWDRVFTELTQSHESLSGYRTPGEGKVGTWCTLDRNKDRMLHHLYVEDSAIHYGERDAIERIVRSAKGLGADRSPEFIARAQRALKRIESENPEALIAYLKSKGVSA